jgi:GNAT superfamily N-acetyltransferase
MGNASPVTIRPATTADIPAIVRFNASLAEETEGLVLDYNRLLEGVRAVIADPAKGFYLLGLHEGVLAGQIMVTTEWSDWRNGTFWWVQSVYVTPDCRSRGVFTALYRHIETLARSRSDICGLRLYVDEHNQRAREAYEHLGMRHARYRMMEVDFVL